MSQKFINNLKQKATKLLEENHIPPQRYGTAFHIRPPVTDVRQLPIVKNSLIKTAPDITLIPAHVYEEFFSLVPEDSYALWLLTHASPQIISIDSQQLQKKTISGSGMWWIYLKPGSKLELEDVIQGHEIGLRRIYIWQEEKSHLKYSGVRANNVFLNEKHHVFLRGPQAATEIVHLTYAKSREQSDIEVSVYHKAQATKSSITVRTVAEAESVSVYRGLIDIDKQAIGSHGYQQGRGLYIGERAVLDMLPQLQIRTNDVSCSHGVTTTHLDERMLFYARSRGLTETQARKLGITGFYHHHLSMSPGISKTLEKVYA